MNRVRGDCAADVFPNDSVIRRVGAENVLLLGGGRALLMQLAHPLVARGVADHSGFEADPFARLRRTLDLSYTMVFGRREQAERAAAHVRAVHEHVQGAGYRANDPELLMWVHATLVDSATLVHRLFLGGLDPAEAEQHYGESMVLAEMLGVPMSDQPLDLASFRSYVHHMTSTLEVSDTARRLARSVLHPRIPRLVEPLAEVGRQLTVGLLPYPLRVQYGLRWDRRRKALLGATTAASRRLLPHVPGAVRRARLVA